MATALPRLHSAAQHGEESKLQQYLNARDDVNARDADGRTALVWASFGNHTNCAKLLLAAGANPSISANDQCFPLYVAAQHGNIAMAKALIGANANVNAIADRVEAGTALLVAAFRGNQSMVEVLLAEGCDTSRKSTDGRYPLTVASFQGHSAVVSQLLHAGADVNAMSTDGVFALTAAAQIGSCNIIKILLVRGAQVNQQRPDGSVALHT